MVFSSSHSERNVEKHFQNLQRLLLKAGHTGSDDTNIVEQDFVNYTKDNKTQGIMEKSQWDLKKTRFQRRWLTRLDKLTLNALLREYSDSMKRKMKTHRVDLERWKQ